MAHVEKPDALDILFTTLIKDGVVDTEHIPPELAEQVAHLAIKGLDVQGLGWQAVDAALRAYYQDPIVT